MFDHVQIDRPYWLQEKREGGILWQGGESGFMLYKDGPTIVPVTFPDYMLAEWTGSAKEQLDILRYLKATVLPGEIRTQYRMRQLNAGIVIVKTETTGETKHYSIYRDTFLIWTVRFKLDPHVPLVICRLVSNSGQSITDLEEV